MEVSCPATAAVGNSASATVTASDGQSGLASDPSGTVPIDTSTPGPKTVSRTAIDNVGHESSASCTTEVSYNEVISGTLKHKLVVKSGQSVELTATARAKQIEVQSGGSLDIEGSSTKGVKSTGASVIRICGATIAGSLQITDSSGSVVIGEGEEACPSSTIAKAATLAGDAGGVSIIGNAFQTNLKVTGGSGGTKVTENTVAKALAVTGNSSEVTDRPNTVGGKSKLQ